MTDYGDVTFAQAPPTTDPDSLEDVDDALRIYLDTTYTLPWILNSYCTEHTDDSGNIHYKFIHIQTANNKVAIPHQDGAIAEATWAP